MKIIFAYIFQSFLDFFRTEEDLCTCGLPKHLGQTCYEAEESTFSVAFNYDDGSIPL